MMRRLFAALFVTVDKGSEDAGMREETPKIERSVIVGVARP